MLNLFPRVYRTTPIFFIKGRKKAPNNMTITTHEFNFESCNSAIYPGKTRPNKELMMSIVSVTSSWFLQPAQNHDKPVLLYVYFQVYTFLLMAILVKWIHQLKSNLSYKKGSYVYFKITQ